MTVSEPTRNVPEAKLPSRHRGSLALHEARCTSCMVCARECPVWCIHITSATIVTGGEEGSATGAGRRRARSEHRLEHFAIDFGVCMYCGLCVQACPFDALAWIPDPVSHRDGPRGLVVERRALAAAWARVPEPLPLEAGSVPVDTRPPRTGRG